MAIPQDYIAELSRRIDIVELIASYVQLKRAGRTEKGLCPFHNEKTPSFTVYPDTNSFYCFGCGTGGDAITFVKNIQNLDYVEAVKFLAAKAGMPMPNEDDSKARLRGKVLGINRETARFYAATLNSEEGKKARSYLRGRALSDGTMRRFGLGYAPDSYGALLGHLKKEGYSEQELLDAGVVKQGQRGAYDAFRDRIIFPIIDLRGNVIAFGGRLMEGQKGPKYLNSSDTPVFKKSRGLFALNLARKSASRRFILTEGYMDVISLHQAGFDTAVAALGTALTVEQVKLISDYADEVVLCYDSDDAGQRAAERAIKLFKDTNLKVTVLTIPDAKDPDEFIKTHGAEAFERLLSGSRNTIEYALQKVKAGFDLGTEDGRAGYIRSAIDVLAAGALPTEQDIYCGRLADETDVAKERILQQLETATNARRRKARQQREQRIMDKGVAKSIQVPYTPGVGGQALGVVHAEQQIIASVLKNPDEYLPLVRQNLQPEQFISPDMAEAFRALCDMQDAGEYIDFTTLNTRLPDKTIANISRILAQNHDAALAKADMELFINRLCQTRVQPAEAAAMDDDDIRALFKDMRERKQ